MYLYGNHKILTPTKPMTVFSTWIAKGESPITVMSSDFSTTEITLHNLGIGFDHCVIQLHSLGHITVSPDTLILMLDTRMPKSDPIWVPASSIKPASAIMMAVVQPNNSLLPVMVRRTFFGPKHDYYSYGVVGDGSPAMIAMSKGCVMFMPEKKHVRSS